MKSKDLKSMSKEKIESQEQDKTKPDTDEQVSGDLKKELRKQAREEIHNENSSRIIELKTLKGKTWHLTKEYRQEISPLIEKRLQEKINANNPGDSN